MARNAWVNYFRNGGVSLLRNTHADTTREKVYIYFLMYDHGIEHSVHTSSPYKLEENEPGAFLLREHWDCGKEPEFTHWYIPALKSLNTEVPDILHLDDTRVEQVK